MEDSGPGFLEGQGQEHGTAEVGAEAAGCCACDEMCALNGVAWQTADQAFWKAKAKSMALQK
jgi:hypothetical protein